MEKTLDLNLFNASLYLPIDSFIIGLGYNDYTRGAYPINKKSFYNQLSLIVFCDGKHMNVKLFRNGTLQVTGCQQESSGDTIANSLYTRMVDINGVIQKHVTFDSNGIPLVEFNNKMYMYSKNSRAVFGEKTGSKYTMNREPLVIKHLDGETCLITYNHFTKNKNIYNLDGILIGKSKVKLLKNMKRLYSNPGSLKRLGSDDCSMYINDTMVAKIAYEIHGRHTAALDNSKNTVDYDKSTGVGSSVPIANINISCINIHFKLGYTIDRLSFSTFIKENGYICTFNPNSYSGVRLVFKVPITETPGYLDKNIVKNISDGTLFYNIIILIFHTGSVIVTGLKSRSSIPMILSVFDDILKDYLDV